MPLHDWLTLVIEFYTSDFYSDCIVIILDDQQIVLCPYRQTVLVFNKIKQQAL